MLFGNDKCIIWCTSVRSIPIPNAVDALTTLRCEGLQNNSRMSALIAGSVVQFKTIVVTTLLFLLVNQMVDMFHSKTETPQSLNFLQ